MDARLNYFASPTAAKALKHLMAAGRTLKESPLPAETQELVALRVSQINGCALCIDMHTKEAAAAGETSVRLNLVAAWREATVFTEAERVHPIQFEMKSTRQDIVSISLPEGFSPDPVPSDIALSCSIGRFEMSYQVKGRDLLVTRQLSITAQNAPASDYPGVKRFFDAAQTASQSSIVLVAQQ